MQKHFLEPGILRVFRFYVIFQFLFILATVLAHFRLGISEDNVRHALALGLMGTLFLLGYLSWPFLQKLLGRVYLPAGILFSTVFSLVQQNNFLRVRTAASDLSSEESAWQIFLFLFIPLILCAWQYNFKAVIIYCFFTAILDFLLLAHVLGDIDVSGETYRRLIFIRSLAFLITGYVIAYIMSRFRQQRDSLEQANRNLTHFASTLEELTVSRERNRMARELHDTMAHTLSGIAVQLEAAQSVLPQSPGEAQPLVARSLEMTRSGLTETRRSLHELRASPLEELGLEGALRSLAVDAAENAGLRLYCQASAALPKFPPDVEQGLYRVAQEAIENVRRHAGAHSMRLAWSCQGGWLVLTISDDGQGFSPENVKGDGRFGLRGMYERATMIGADLTVASQPGQGATVCLKVKV